MKRSSARQNFLHFTILRCFVSFDFKLRRKVWDDKVEKLEVNSIFYKYKTAIHDPDLALILANKPNSEFPLTTLQVSVKK